MVGRGNWSVDIVCSGWGVEEEGLCGSRGGIGGVVGLVRFGGGVVLSIN